MIKDVPVRAKPNLTYDRRILVNEDDRPSLENAKEIKFPRPKTYSNVETIVKRKSNHLDLTLGGPDTSINPFISKKTTEPVTP